MIVFFVLVVVMAVILVTVCGPIAQQFLQKGAKLHLFLLGKNSKRIDRIGFRLLK